MLLAIDPGQAKCGWALVDQDGTVVARGICARWSLQSELASLAAQYPVDRLVLGNRTGHRTILAELLASAEWRTKVCLVEEDRSSEEARRRYVLATTRGWRRIIPASFRSPKGPYDDYVAVILAERFLKNGPLPRSESGVKGRIGHPVGE